MFEKKEVVAQPQRIMGKVVGQEVSREELEVIAGGDGKWWWSCGAMLVGPGYQTDIIE